MQVNYFDKLLSTSQKQNFCYLLISQKEINMQALDVKPASVPNLALRLHLVNEIYEPPLHQKFDKTQHVKAKEANILSLQKPKNMKRLLEAYSDCV